MVVRKNNKGAKNCKRNIMLITTLNSAPLYDEIQVSRLNQTISERTIAFHDQSSFRCRGYKIRNRMEIPHPAIVAPDTLMSQLCRGATVEAMFPGNKKSSEIFLLKYSNRIVSLNRAIRIPKRVQRMAATFSHPYQNFSAFMILFGFYDH
jgi:hypothetical protein